MSDKLEYGVSSGEILMTKLGNDFNLYVVHEDGSVVDMPEAMASAMRDQLREAAREGVTYAKIAMIAFGMELNITIDMLGDAPESLLAQIDY